MTGRNKNRGSMGGSIFRKAAMFAGMLGMTLFIMGSGCPGQQCTSDADCDDSDLCTTDTCGADGACVNTPVDCPDGVCDPASGTCVECLTDADCAEGEACDEGVCVATCTEDADCNDEDMCTVDACVEGLCENTPVDCPDGVCNPATGTCVECLADTDCAEGEVCEENACEPEAVSCTTDEECDDGLFCNGAETCGADGFCVDGTSPCAEDETCEEGDDAAVCIPPTPETLDFTLGQDDLPGTSGDDIFRGPLEFSPGAGVQVATLQTGDAANGFGGNDTLNATLNGVAVVPTLVGIEDMNFTAFAATVLTATNVTGVNNINSMNSTADLTVNSLQQAVDLGITGILDPAVDLIANFVTAVTTGTTDEIGVNVSGSTDAGRVEIASPGGVTNGFETLAVASEGTAANKLAEIRQTNATSLKTANFSGSQALQVITMPNTILTYASTMTGGLTLGNGTSVNGATPYAAFHVGADLKSMTMGSGADVLIFGATLNANDAAGATELIDLGDGNDVVQASFAATVGTQLKLRNVEEVRFNATANGVSVNLGGVTGLTAITNEQDGAAHTFTLLNVPSTVPDLNYRGNNNQAAQTYDAITYTSPSAPAGSTLDVNVNNRGTALNETGTANAHNIGTLTAANISTINLTIADGPAIFNGITAANATTFNFTASSNLTLGAVAGGAVVSVNASGVVGNFAGTFTTVANGGSVTIGNGTNTVSIAGSPGTTINVQGGTGNDTITGSGQADVISGGTGDDVIISGAGIDTLTGGGGADTFAYNTIVAAANANNITDFAAGAGGDVLRFDATTFTDYAAGAAVTFDPGGAGCAALTVAVDSVIIRNTAANILLTTPAAGVQAVIAIATDTGAIYYDANGNFTAGAVIIGSLTPAQVANIVAANILIVP